MDHEDDSLTDLFEKVKESTAFGEKFEQASYQDKVTLLSNAYTQVERKYDELTSECN